MKVSKLLVLRAAILNTFKYCKLCFCGIGFFLELIFSYFFELEVSLHVEICLMPLKNIEFFFCISRKCKVGRRLSC